MSKTYISDSLIKAPITHQYHEVATFCQSRQLTISDNAEDYLAHAGNFFSPTLNQGLKRVLSRIFA